MSTVVTVGGRGGGGCGGVVFFFFLMIRRPPRSTLDRSSAASDVYKRQELLKARRGALNFVEAGIRPARLSRKLYVCCATARWMMYIPSTGMR